MYKGKEVKVITAYNVFTGVIADFDKNKGLTVLDKETGEYLLCIAKTGIKKVDNGFLLLIQKIEQMIQEGSIKIELLGSSVKREASEKDIKAFCPFK